MRYLYLNICCTSSKYEIILNDILKFRKMPRIPFSNSHRKCINIFIHLI